jgi:hypothetical protein
MKIKVFIFLIVITNVCKAQPPWRAKLYVNFLDSNNQTVIDTVWFGFDSLGAEGYQEGLDIIDTNLQWNKVYGSDEIIKNQYNTSCPNMRTNIVSHTLGYTWFKFFALGNIKSIGWDSSDFNYMVDSGFRMTYVYINSLNGYIGFFDAKNMSIRGEWIDSPGTIERPVSYYITPPLDAIPQVSLSSFCNSLLPFNSNGFRFDIVVRTGPTMLNSLSKGKVLSKLVKYDATNKKLFWDETFNPTSIKIYNSYGACIEQQINISSQHTELNNLHNGMYFIHIKGEQYDQILKIIIL